MAYHRWTRVETFPGFMDGVEQINQLDAIRSHWVTKVEGVTREFDTEITEQHPDELVAWRTVGARSSMAAW